jgi:hypothetical protein
MGVDDPVQATLSTSMHAHHRRVREPPFDGRDDYPASFGPDLDFVRTIP